MHPAVLRFTSLIKIRDVINPYILVTATQARTIKPGWRKPLPVLVRINGEPKLDPAAVVDTAGEV